MIRKLEIVNLEKVIKIWLEANIQAHEFIPESYWLENYDEVKNLLPQAEVYVYEDDGEIKGFIGLAEEYIAGIFTSILYQSKGIGKELLEYVKEKKDNISLKVYVKNCRAVNFYEREGFKIISETIDENTGEKELYMVWKKC